MIDYLNQVWSVLSGYVSFLFKLNFAPGVSIGSILLVSSLLWAISRIFWPR